ncbi:MAG: 4-alpha-glucanotransferase [Tidjanibacter sp.]|nr:4-alpha-glucanotransferase [Tidjanibacter sp.]
MNNIYKTSPFDTFFPHEKPTGSNAATRLTFEISAPVASPSERLFVCGNIEGLGQWNTNRAVEASLVNYPVWRVSFDVSRLTDSDFEYKFIIKRGNSVVWEEGENRRWNFHPIVGEEVVEANFRGNLSWHGAGLAIPVFSLRSAQSQGIGDFVDLAAMAEWAALTGQKVIQILPVNDTTQNYNWRDSYPYRSISIFALHPLYLSIVEMGAKCDPEIKALNALSEVDYDRVGELKWRFFREEFARIGRKTMRSAAFKKFYKSNRDWLDNYAVFCALRDHYRSADFSTWGGEAVYSKELVDRKSAEGSDNVALYLWLQFHLDRQLRAAVEHCRSLGVVLKGDIPIGISRDSVEAWSQPELFNMTSQAGAPPDDFSATGQNWGFPTYNWDLMAADGYSWWRRRFEKMADYFDLYRIDHILGFFRIWEIPLDEVDGLLGHFNPALPLGCDELARRGMPMNRQRYLIPQIEQNRLAEMFGDEDPAAYLEPLSDGLYTPKAAYRTQRQIEAALSAEHPRAASVLMQIVTDVLFVEDPLQKEYYHPRIAARQTNAYKRLGEEQKRAFDAIYDDFFFHRHNDFWGEQAMRKLPVLIGATRMMCCGEDLGMIPASVAPVMKTLGILSLEIQRMPKDPSVEFALTNCYPYMSVATTSTHDMSTLRGWWRENPEASQRYYNSILWQSGRAPEEATAEVCRLIVANHLCSPAVLTILPWQDWLSISDLYRRKDVEAERINVPSDPNRYWRYRMHLGIEELMGAEQLNADIAQMISDSRRS